MTATAAGEQEEGQLGAVQISSFEPSLVPVCKKVSSMAQYCIFAGRAPFSEDLLGSLEGRGRIHRARAWLARRKRRGDRKRLTRPLRV